MLMKNLQIEPVEAEKDDTDLALGVAQAVEEDTQKLQFMVQQAVS